MQERTLELTKRELILIMIERLHHLKDHPAHGSSNERAELDDANNLWKEILQRYGV